MQQHMADTLRQFFAVFSLLNSVQPQVLRARTIHVTYNNQRLERNLLTVVLPTCSYFYPCVFQIVPVAF